MKFLFTFFLFALFAFSGMAENLTTKSGKTYKDYTVRKFKSKGMAIIHSNGFNTIPYDELPDNVVKKFSKEIKKVKASAEKKQLRRQARLEKQKKRREEDKKLEKIEKLFYTYVKAVHIFGKNSILASNNDYKGVFYITDINTKSLVTDSNIPFNNVKYINKNHYFNAYSPNAKNPIQHTLYKKCAFCNTPAPKISDKKQLETALYNLQKKQCSKKSRARKAVSLYCIGTYSYTTIAGSKNTVYKFTYNRQKALDFLERNHNASSSKLKREAVYIPPPPTRRAYKPSKAVQAGSAEAGRLQNRRF